MEHKLHRTDRQLASAGAVLEFYRDTMVLPDGQVQTWDYVHHKKGGGACTVPVLPDGRILLIRQFRPAIDREALELPAGARDSSGEDPAVTAARELEEETGYRPGRMTKLAHILTAIAWCNESTDIYLARDLERSRSRQRRSSSASCLWMIFAAGFLRGRSRMPRRLPASWPTGVSLPWKSRKMLPDRQRQMPRKIRGIPTDPPLPQTAVKRGRKTARENLPAEFSGRRPCSISCGV